MKKVITLLVIFFFVFLSTNQLFSQKNSEDGKFEKTLESYFDELWKFFPTAATLAGYHKYDNKLENFGNKNIEKRHEALDKFNEELVTKIDKFKLSPELQIDHGMIIEAIDTEIIKHENLLPWEYNPIFYNEIIINSIKSLLTKEFAPFDARAKNAAERLNSLPGFIKEAKKNLKTPPQIFTETAIKQFPAILSFYKSELPQLIEPASAATKSKLQGDLAKVIPALEDYQNFLQNELLPKSTGNFRLGEQAHRKLVQLTIQNNIPLQELIARAKADYKNIRREMFLVCIPFYKIMDPKINLDKPPSNLNEEQLINTTISHVLDRIKGEHATKDEFIDKIKSSVDETKEFLLNNQFVELPEGELNIQPMPLECQGITWTRLISPEINNPSGAYTCQIAPIPDDWGAEQAQSFLEEYNDFHLYFWTIRKVYPGQYAPIFFTRKFPSQIRSLYPNMALIKGWPVYVEEALMRKGFGNYDLRLRLNQLKYKLKAAIDLQLDFNIHEGGMTKEQAIAYMIRGGFQSQVEAERKWNQIILNPGDCILPYVGFQEILDMEKEYRKLKGDAFSEKDFLSKLLSYGALPLRHLKRKVLE